MHCKLKHTLASRGQGYFFFLFICLFIVLLSFPCISRARIYIDINAPSFQKFQIAIPEFGSLTGQNQCGDFGANLLSVVSSDLDFSGLFSIIDKKAYLVGQAAGLSAENINYKDWSAIGAELLLLGTYACSGGTLEIEARLFDVFSGQQVLGKRVSGNRDHYRYLIHRLSNEIVQKLTGYPGIFLTKLSFISDTSGNKEVYISDYDGYNVKQITRDRSIILLPRLSPDRKRITYTSYKEGEPILYLRNLESGSVKRLSGGGPGMNTGGSWAPDGDNLAVTISKKGNPDIYIIGLDGGITDRLTTYDGIDISPTYSPDGNRIAFVSDRSGAPQIYILGMGSGKTSRLTYNMKYCTSPSWSSLNRIAFAGIDGGRLDIFTIDANGGQAVRCTNGQGKNEDPCWSPDGRYIVFSSNRSGRYNLYIMNANGQNQKRIKALSGNQTSPSWAQ
ncbi:Protein TolB [uncultured Desulfobacterium sp.]|uniref:Protein TolB n=1 Tax=uncultured Desulfobacterium sp. TaxID=201089 RepID=A0A445MSW5_9BACT|nr:Protein TolB [uncultured Desulfobacterium sp.]